jgi:hypothetical protein
MARRWKMAAGIIAWLGMGGALRAQTLPPPLPVGVSMQPMVPTATWTPPVYPPLSSRVALPSGQQYGMPAEYDPLGLDSKTVRKNAFTDDPSVNGGGGGSGNGDSDDGHHGYTHSVNLEYLIMWFKSHTHGPLITSGNANDAVPGALGQPGTVIVHDDRDGPGASSAFRITYTWWLEPDFTCIDASFFIMEQRRLIFGVASNAQGQPVLARPFFNPSAVTEDADPRALPFVARASLEDNFYTRLMGAEANFKCNLSGEPCTKCPVVTLMFGPRWIRLDEKYVNNDVSQDLPAGSGDTRTFTDNITCYNEFIGGQVGASVCARWQRLIMDTSFKIAVGENFRTLKMSGGTLTHNDATGAITQTGEGFFVQSTNSGISHSDRISIVPEFNFSLGYYVTDNFKVSVGYGVFDMSNVLRPGNQIDRRIDLQAPGIPTTLPARSNQSTDFWAQWINFGFEFIF